MATPIEDVMLTTIDNPWSPFTHYKEWLAFDEARGYYSNALLARVTVSSNELSEYDQELDIMRAIDEIVRENVSGMHRKVYPDSVMGSVAA
jgi:hypothetical protein